MNRAELLAELSTLLGLEVSNVDRARSIWYLKLPCTPAVCICRMGVSLAERIELPRDWTPRFPHARWERFGKSGDFRNWRRLNGMLKPERQGRKPYTNEDGHRAVKLMFEIWNPREET